VPVIVWSLRGRQVRLRSGSRKMIQQLEKS
jgi:hypothetical protein